MINRRRKCIGTVFRAGACVATLALAAQAAAEQISKVAILSGQQENPDVASPGFGCGRFIVDTAADTLSYYIAFGSLAGAETAAHIHGPADPGMNAGVQHGLPAGSPKVGVWNYPAALEADILAGKMYVNIHSAVAPGGELRGQIVDRVALIDQAEEVPPSGTAGVGFGLFNINTVSNRLDYYVEIASLSSAETAAHIHGFVLHGVNAGVQHGLGVGSPKIGTWVYPEADEKRILDGMTYVNVHTVNFPGGEIRGQIVGIVNPIDGRQENPPVATPGHGCALLAIDEANDLLSYDVRHASLTGPATAAHIHGYVGPGGNAGVVHGIGPATPTIGTWNYPAANEGDIRAGMTYVNVHTAANPGGEIRGQLHFPNRPCVADINSSGAVDFGDILAVLGAWGKSGPEDVDKSGSVDFGDILVILGTWGPCP